LISITLQGTWLSFLAWNSLLLSCKNYIFLNITKTCMWFFVGIAIAQP
jgi:hypothetical protein